MKTRIFILAITLVLSSGCGKLRNLICQSNECHAALDCGELEESDYTGTYSGYVDINSGSNLEQVDDNISITTGSNSNDNILEGSSTAFGNFKIQLSTGSECFSFSLDSTSLQTVTTYSNKYYHLNSFLNTIHNTFDGCKKCTNAIFLNSYFYSDSSKNFSNFRYEMHITGSLYKEF